MGQLCTKCGVGGSDTGDNHQGSGGRSRNDDESSHNESSSEESQDSNSNAEDGGTKGNNRGIRGEGKGKSGSNRSRSSNKSSSSNDEDDLVPLQQPSLPSTTSKEGGYGDGTGKHIKGMGLTSGKSHKTYSPGDVFTSTVGKVTRKQDPGLKVEEVNGKYYVTKVYGLFATTPVMVGDKILEMNEKDYRKFKNVKMIRKELVESEGITVLMLRRDPDASQSSASSYNSDSDNEYDDDE